MLMFYVNLPMLCYRYALLRVQGSHLGGWVKICITKRHNFYCYENRGFPCHGLSWCRGRLEMGDTVFRSRGEGGGVKSAMEID